MCAMLILTNSGLCLHTAELGIEESRHKTEEVVMKQVLGRMYRIIQFFYLEATKKSTGNIIVVAGKKKQSACTQEVLSVFYGP